MENLTNSATSLTKASAFWPQLDFQACKDTYETLHRWSQVVGKIKLARSPWVNHSWHATLFVTPTGLGTGAFDAGAGRSLSIDLDFFRHTITFALSDGQVITEGLRSESMASFYCRVEKILSFLNIEAVFERKASEMDESVVFEKDTRHRSYNPFHVTDFWQALCAIDLVFKEFRGDFTGKSSPVHFFWGSFDLAVTRFSGREAPEHPAGFPNIPDIVVKEAYSQEVASFGFFPGNEMYPRPAFYSYAYPEPEGYAQKKLEPQGAFYHPEMREFLLPYEEVAKSGNPKEELLRFLNSAYDAASLTGKWDRKSLAPGKFLGKLRQKNLKKSRLQQ